MVIWSHVKQWNCLRMLRVHGCTDARCCTHIGVFRCKVLRTHRCILMQGAAHTYGCILMQGAAHTRAHSDARCCAHAGVFWCKVLHTHMAVFWCKMLRTHRCIHAGICTHTGVFMQDAAHTGVFWCNVRAAHTGVFWCQVLIIFQFKWKENELSLGNTISLPVFNKWKLVKICVQLSWWSLH